MTFEEFIGPHKIIDPLKISEAAMGAKAQALVAVGEGDPYLDGYRIHRGLFSRIPEAHEREARGYAASWYGPTQKDANLVVAVHERQVVTFGYAGIMWCRHDHRGNRLMAEVQAKRIELYRNSSRFYLDRPDDEPFTPNGLKTVRHAYNLCVERGVIQGEA